MNNRVLNPPEMADGKYLVQGRNQSNQFEN